MIFKTGFIIGNFTSTDMMGIIVITVVCCAVFTSVVWVVIIYQTRRRLTPHNGHNHPVDNSGLEFTDKVGVQFNDAASDKSSCKDSGTGDSDKRSNDDLVVEVSEAQIGRKMLRLHQKTYEYLALILLI